MIRLGNQDIDFSPAFTMFLSTRDPSVEFSPDISSCVTFVNFTMMRSSVCRASPSIKSSESSGQIRIKDAPTSQEPRENSVFVFVSSSVRSCRP